jgi:hypothetical protein
MKKIILMLLVTALVFPAVCFPQRPANWKWHWGGYSYSPSVYYKQLPNVYREPRVIYCDPDYSEPGVIYYQSNWPIKFNITINQYRIYKPDRTLELLSRLSHPEPTYLPPKDQYDYIPYESDKQLAELRERLHAIDRQIAEKKIASGTEEGIIAYAKSLGAKEFVPPSPPPVVSYYDKSTSTYIYSDEAGVPPILIRLKPGSPEPNEEQLAVLKELAFWTKKFIDMFEKLSTEELEELIKNNNEFGEQFIWILEGLSPEGIGELIKNTKSDVCRQFIVEVLKDIAEKKTAEAKSKEEKKTSSRPR